MPARRQGRPVANAGNVTVIFAGHNGGVPVEVPLKGHETPAKIGSKLNIPMDNGAYSIKLTRNGSNGGGDMQEARIDTKLADGDMVAVSKTSHKSG